MTAEVTNRFSFRSAIFLLLRDGKKILMYKRINTGHEDGNYSLVSGHLDGGESAQKGVVREAKEELGIEIEENNLRVVHVMHYKNEHFEYFNVYLTADIWKGEIENMEPNLCGDLSWFERDTLPKNTIPYIRLALDSIDAGIFYSSFGF